LRIERVRQLWKTKLLSRVPLVGRRQDTNRWKKMGTQGSGGEKGGAEQRGGEEGAYSAWGKKAFSRCRNRGQNWGQKGNQAERKKKTGTRKEGLLHRHLSNRERGGLARRNKEPEGRKAGEGGGSLLGLPTEAGRERNPQNGSKPSNGKGGAIFLAS